MTSAVFRSTANASQPSLTAPTLPPYTEYPQDIDQQDIELATLSRTTSSESLEASFQEGSSSAASSSANPSNFNPTVQLQVQTEGKPWLSLPVPPKAVPIPIFSLTADGRLDRPRYMSIRPARNSGSCYLVDGEDETATPLTTTTYRFGPGKPPRVRLIHPANPEREEDFEILRPKKLSRTVAIETTLGNYQWRYADSKEKAAYAANSLLVFEKTDGSKDKGTRLAQLVRNEKFRSPNSVAATAGNGGRLMIDLSQVDEKQREQLQRLVVTTCIVMLKKEVDRRRTHQFMIMGAAAGAH